MRQGWQEFVHQSLKGAADAPHVRLLRERLRSGSSVVRVHLDDAGRQPEYRVLLSQHRQLSEMRVPHSESFTRWSLETGTRLATPEEEARRFALLLRERFEPLEQELGRDHFNTLLREQLRRLGPPQALSLIDGWQLAYHPADGADGRDRRKALALIDSVLASLARDLRASLGYSEQETAELLDAALRHYLGERYGSVMKERLEQVRSTSPRT
ncbi:MAG TPA: hypothetical protein VEY88_21150 [Archangium sp.]|nr:hypothetical protein [Archangium sp.]